MSPQLLHHCAVCRIFITEAFTGVKCTGCRLTMHRPCAASASFRCPSCAAPLPLDSVREWGARKPMRKGRKQAGRKPEVELPPEPLQEKGKKKEVEGGTGKKKPVGKREREKKRTKKEGGDGKGEEAMEVVEKRGVSESEALNRKMWREGRPKRRAHSETDSRKLKDAQELWKRLQNLERKQDEDKDMIEEILVRLVTEAGCTQYASAMGKGKPLDGEEIFHAGRVTLAKAESRMRSLDGRMAWEFQGYSMSFASLMPPGRKMDLYTRVFTRVRAQPSSSRTDLGEAMGRLEERQARAVELSLAVLEDILEPSNNARNRFRCAYWFERSYGLHQTPGGGSERIISDLTNRLNLMEARESFTY